MIRSLQHHFNFLISFLQSFHNLIKRTLLHKQHILKIPLTNPRLSSHKRQLQNLLLPSQHQLLKNRNSILKLFLCLNNRLRKIIITLIRNLFLILQIRRNLFNKILRNRLQLLTIPLLSQSLIKFIVGYHYYTPYSILQ